MSCRFSQNPHRHDHRRNSQFDTHTRPVTFAARVLNHPHRIHAGAAETACKTCAVPFEKLGCVIVSGIVSVIQPRICHSDENPSERDLHAFAETVVALAENRGSAQLTGPASPCSTPLNLSYCMSNVASALRAGVTSAKPVIRLT